MDAYCLLSLILIPIIIGVSAQIHVYRNGINKTVGGSVALGFSVGFVFLLIIWELCVKEPSPDRFVAVTIIYLCAVYSFFHANNMGETSRRIRLGLELVDAQNGLTYDALLEKYNWEIQVDRRLTRLLAFREIIEVQNVIYLKRYRFLAMYFSLAVLKYIIFGSRSN